MGLSNREKTGGNENDKKYFAYCTSREGQCWGFEVKADAAGDLFTVDLAKRILDFADKKYPEQFPDRKKEEFNYIKLDMGSEKVGRYYLDENLLQIYNNGVPIFESRNGKICRDSVAIMDN